MHRSDSIRIRSFAHWFLSGLLVVLCMGFLWAAPAQASALKVSGIVTDKLNLRQGPSRSTTVVAELPKGASLTVLGVQGDWLKVMYKNTTGYVKGEYVSILNAVQGATETGSGDKNLTPPNKKRTDITLKEGVVSEDVLDLQEALRKKGYFSSALSTEYGYYTQKAVELFQKRNNLTITGIADPKTLKTLYGKRSDLPDKVYDYSDYTETDTPGQYTEAAGSTYSGEVEATLVNRNVKLVDWWSGEIQKILTRGKTVTILDVQTGLSFKAQRLGGSSHADMEPLTQEDTAIMKRSRGGEWGWSARAVYVVIDGQTFAAAINGYPHGGENLAGNSFEGHFCLHFLNSRTHRTNRKNPDMQDRLMEAFEAAGER